MLLGNSGFSFPHLSLSDPLTCQESHFFWGGGEVILTHGADCDLRQQSDPGGIQAPTPLQT